MPISSIKKHFVISGKEQVEMFVNALEESAKHVVPQSEMQVTELTSAKEIKEFMKRRKNTNIF